MNILAVCGSPRKGGNTELLVRAALKGAGAGQAKVHFVSRMDLSGCLGCGACRKEGAKGCKVKDEMQGMYALMREADAIVMGSPIYYGELTGQMKCFMDRWYALRDKDRNLRIPEGKRALFILVQGADGEDRYAHTRERVGKILTSYGMAAEVLVAPGCEHKGAAAEMPDLLERARTAGENLK